MPNITILSISSDVADTSTLRQIATLSNLRELQFSSDYPFTDLEPLRSLKNLERLRFSLAFRRGRNVVVDISALGQLVNLKWLCLDLNAVSVEPLFNLKSLRVLDPPNPITDEEIHRFLDFTNLPKVYRWRVGR